MPRAAAAEAAAGAGCALHRAAQRATRLQRQAGEERAQPGPARRRASQLLRWKSKRPAAVSEQRVDRQPGEGATRSRRQGAPYSSHSVRVTASSRGSNSATASTRQARRSARAVLGERAAGDRLDGGHGARQQVEADATAAIAGTSCASDMAKKSAAAATSAASSASETPQSATPPGAAQASSGSANSAREQRAAGGESGKPPEVCAERVSGSESIELEALVVASRAACSHDMRGDQEHGARAQQARDDASCSARLSVSATCDRNAARHRLRSRRAGGEPGQPAAASFDQHKAGEIGGRHGFVCRLVAACHHATRATLSAPYFTRLANATWSFSRATGA